MLALLLRSAFRASRSRMRLLRAVMSAINRLHFPTVISLVAGPVFHRHRFGSEPFTSTVRTQLRDISPVRLARASDRKEQTPDLQPYGWRPAKSAPSKSISRKGVMFRPWLAGSGQAAPTGSTEGFFRSKKSSADCSSGLQHIVTSDHPRTHLPLRLPCLPIEERAATAGRHENRLGRIPPRTPVPSVGYVEALS